MESYFIGIDESGRGAVIGPLIYAAVVWREELEASDALKAIRLTDSKRMSAAQRNAAFALLRELESQEKLYIFVEEVSPEQISRRMLSESKSLNDISLSCAFALIQTAIDKGISLSHAFIDVVGMAGTYLSELHRRFPNEQIKFTVESGADLTYKTVSAASVVAKVTREERVAAWRATDPTADKDWHNGYPNAATLAWLRRNCHPVLGFPEIVRWSWQPAQAVAAEAMAPFAFRDGLQKIVDPITLRLLGPQSEPPFIAKALLYRSLREKLSFDSAVDLMD